jgi:predicted metalloprotease with PDZ domain
MIHYTFYQKNPASHYVYIDMVIKKSAQQALTLQLPAWRPGRYELGNFAKNIKRVDVFDKNGKPLQFNKSSKDTWHVEAENETEVKVTYSYYAAELNAGACFADAHQLYINPIHCCMYHLEQQEVEHRVSLQIPENFNIACSLKRDGNNLIASNYDELVDSPFIASAQLQSDFYEVNGIKFWLHFNGICKPDWELYKTNFQAFTRKQIQFWNDFPYSEFHFLFQILPYKFYHGVEHKMNTVIAIGPGYNINEGLTYEDVLGVSCHELFHVWNIKTIRPIEMLPYDYTKENYARTGYVYEGFTTYYGDKLLLSSNVFNLQQYFNTLQERLQKHFHNVGRYNLSVAHSSWETWLDGYVPGAPYRKTNIYDEGNLIALILDVSILNATNHQKCLRDVCVLLYERFGKLKKGYLESDIINLVNEVSGKDHSSFFKTFVYSPNDYETALMEAFGYLGIELIKSPSTMCNEHLFGFKTIENGLFSKVSLVLPYSPAWKCGLFNGDDIIAINGIALKNNLNNWLNYFSSDENIELTVISNEQLKTLHLEKDKKGNTYFFNPILKLKDNTQNDNFIKWMQL